MGGLSELKNAVTSIDNDGAGELPRLLIATQNILYILKKKTTNIYKVDKKNQIVTFR